jgi:rhodanese-related sulfurtransferase
MIARNDPVKAKEYFAAKMSFTTGPIELDRMMKSEDGVRIVDVRTADDYGREHIPGSVNLPKDRWDTLQGLAKDKLNVVLCYSQVCHLGATAAVKFAEAGFSVMELEGGFKSWKEHRLPVEGQAEKAGDVAPAPPEELRKQLARVVTELQTIRDDVRVRVHLASLEAKAALAELEARLDKLQGEVTQSTDKALHKLRDSAVELRTSLRALRERLGGG